MGLKKAILLLFVLLISGCTASKSGGISPDDGRVRTFAEIYRRAKESGMTSGMLEVSMGLGSGLGEEKPYFPVYEPPRIIKVWIPAHMAEQDSKVMVAGHWAFVIVEDPHWYVQDESAVKAQVPVIVPTAPEKE